MYKVIEAANMLGVSKVTIYKKINLFKKELKPHIQVKKNIKYIDEQGIEIIKASLIANKVIFEGDLHQEKIIAMEDQLSIHKNQTKWYNERLIEVTNESIFELRSICDILKGQIMVKECQLAAKSELIDQYKDLNLLNKERIKTLERQLETV